MTGRVLVVDDDRDMCRLLAHDLSRRGFEVMWSTSGAEAIEVAGTTELDVVLTDIEMADVNGIDLCRHLVANCPDVPVTMLTAFGTVETVIAALRAGASDLILKPPDMDGLASAVERAVQRRALQREVRRLTGVGDKAGTFDQILGDSRPIRQLTDCLGRVVDSDASVLVTGETGTGKELVARALHRRGRRHAGPFVPFNCAAIPHALVESELFGHVRGAFTDAHTSRTGLFLQAHGGTLFLDEIAELPLAVQPKMLRALQERAIRPVGADREVPCDVRLVAATNRDLESAVREGHFRADLFFRINVIHVEIPPLRARGTDVLLLAQHFLDRCARQAGKAVRTLSPPAADRIVGYHWPGNVRELQNCIEHAVAFARYEHLVVSDLPKRIQQTRSRASAAHDDSRLLPLDEVERRHILRVLDSAGGNRTLAARTLGVDRKTLYRRLARYARG